MTDKRLPDMPAKPKGKWVWLIGALLLLGYYAIDKNPPLQQAPITVILDIPKDLPAEQAVYWRGVKAGLEFESLLASGVSFDRILALQAPLQASEDLLTLTVTPDGLRSDYRSAAVTIWSVQMTDPLDQKQATYGKLRQLLFKTLTIFKSSASVFPETEGGLVLAIQGLYAYQQGDYHAALGYWSLLQAKSTSPELYWLRAIAAEKTENKINARSDYMSAVNLDPTLSKYLPSWVLGLN